MVDWKTKKKLNQRDCFTPMSYFEVFVDTPPLDPWPPNTWGFLRCWIYIFNSEGLLLRRDGKGWFGFTSLCAQKVLEAVLYMRSLLNGAHIGSRNSEDRCIVGKGQVYGHPGEWRLWSNLFWKYRNVQFPADSGAGGKPQKNTFS